MKQLKSILATQEEHAQIMRQRAAADQVESASSVCKLYYDGQISLCDAYGRIRKFARYDGLAAHCLSSRRTGNPRGWPFTARINPKTGRSGPAPKPGRDGDKLQARARVNHEIACGRLPRPSELTCVDCGHSGSKPRHEYDHHKGYSAEHHLTVEPVCSPCHHARERARREFPR